MQELAHQSLKEAIRKVHPDWPEREVLLETLRHVWDLPAHRWMALRSALEQANNGSY